VRTVFIGTSAFAAAVLERLAESEHAPALVLSRPDRPRGRGRKLSAPPVVETARRLRIVCEQPEKINESQALEMIAGARPQAVIVCAFGALIREPLLSAYELLNVHPSLLPRWRGAAPVERAIMAGDASTGVSIMRLTAGLDSGPVCLTQATEIEPEDTYGSLAERLQTLGGELIVGVLDATARGEPPAFVEQDEAGATYAEKITAEDRLLDPARSAVELERVVRALHPHIGARIALADGSMLGVRAARALTLDPAAVPVPAPASAPRAMADDPDSAHTTAPMSSLSPPPPPPPPPPPAGTLTQEGERLLYVTRDGLLELTCIQPPGSRPMDAAAYLRGHAL
jgi:methionyl-tRNA formyltransferase